MRTTPATHLFAALPASGRNRLLGLAKDVVFPAGTRIFEEGGPADRFWVIHTGSVVLDTPVPGRRPAPVEVLSPGDLLGCSWLFPPYLWHLGAEAQSDVRAQEFDATAVRALARADLELGEALARRVAEITAHRMQSARIRLLDLYGPHGAGMP
ncbi:Crp/Fnr family transcriptional regulator [Actinacidiphila acididurans]|uniref:Cyclic nucleotide-binding domain-containing protein n=1 Tax=Actinacidiphila acididurans TaxID=2784346 RepID=A0ABS2TX79_9ACTN|nr:cyclic nucleotide-binding domain-containing protein [Actinacidiphila acididurans]MBM9507951.1 cyclic nucleotide-binding domain-containing protein [Actinacidiphila acididurans]